MTAGPGIGNDGGTPAAGAVAPADDQDQIRLAMEVLMLLGIEKAKGLLDGSVVAVPRDIAVDAHELADFLLSGRRGGIVGRSFRVRAGMEPIVGPIRTFRDTDLFRKMSAKAGVRERESLDKSVDSRDSPGL